MPINLNAPSIYFGVDNFHGIQPRAIIGSFIYLLPLEKNNVNFIGNLIRLVSTFAWLFFIHLQLGRSIFSTKLKHIELNKAILYLALGFIFAASSTSYLSFSSSGIIDAFPSSIIALVVTSEYLIGSKNQWPFKVFIISGLLVLATWAHEKTLYDIAILFVWFSYRWGLKRSSLYFLPGLFLSLALIVRMAHKVTSGETPAGYLAILSSGVEFFWIHAFSISGAAIGGGALWGIYWLASSKLIRTTKSSWDYWTAVFSIFLMLVICFLPLLVALDTSRLCALIWLPALLVLKEINPTELFSSTTRKWVLLALCILQALIPPMLVYQKGIAPFNCYGLWLGQFLPPRSEVDIRSLGLFVLSTHTRPDYTDFFINQCPKK
ncbi:hypothetical protein [Polynucleobacter sp. IMCC 30228]|uniref:hypothetical protein n=1 Tax=Polynucleobacter sp. IMCC 30228 TaxID=2781011 RepID=UPI001F39419D|nr:hypothetical protein [Polynucleobacter sp. IMCC 30228]MCE7527817.1 hypothetical protein [Polynucleobacter sp. IMCC 30228]